MDSVLSYRDYKKFYDDTEMLHRSQFIQVHSGTDKQSDERNVIFVHEIPTLKRIQHEKVFKEFKTFLQLCSTNKNLLRVDRMFVKISDEMHSRSDELTSRIYYLTSREQYSPLKDIKNPFPNLVEKWFYQAVTTLKFLQEKNIFHYNVNPSSLVVTGDENQNLKISMIGFGFENFANLLGNDETTEDFVAPEILDDEIMTSKSDVYSLGQTFFHLIGGEETVRKIYKSQIPDLLELLKKCIEEEEEDRISFEEIVKKIIHLKPADDDIPPTPEISEDLLSDIQTHKVTSLKKVKWSQQATSDSGGDRIDLMSSLKSSIVSRKESSSDESEGEEDPWDDAPKKSSVAPPPPAPARGLPPSRDKSRAPPRKIPPSSSSSSSSSRVGGGGTRGGFMRGRGGRGRGRGAFRGKTAPGGPARQVPTGGKQPPRRPMDPKRKPTPKIRRELNDFDMEKELESAQLRYQRKKIEEEEEEEEEDNDEEGEIKPQFEEKERKMEFAKKKSKKRKKEVVNLEEIADVVEVQETKTSIPVKVVFLGESAVGKSSLLLRFARGEFHEYQESTIGAAFMTQVEPKSGLKLECWDTAGQERYKSLAPMYYRGASGALVVFDVTSVESFERAKRWVKELKRQASQDMSIILVGNKNDLEGKRKISIKEAEEWCAENGLEYRETSAKTGKGVNDTFVSLSSKMKENIVKESHMSFDDSVADGKSFTLKRAESKKKAGCCAGGNELDAIGDGISGLLSGIFSGLFPSKKRGSNLVVPPKALTNTTKFEPIKKPDIVAPQKPLSFLSNQDGLKQKEKYETVKIIGQGGQSSVFLVKEKSSGIQYVMKKYKNNLENELEYELELKAFGEFSKLSSSEEQGGKHIVQFVNDFKYTDNYGDVNRYVIMEYCELGDLNMLLRKIKKKRRARRNAQINEGKVNVEVKFSVKMLLSFIEQLLLGVSAIHSVNFVHHDLKPQNIFVMKDNTLKIGDFGFCCHTDLEEKMKDKVKGGTFKYMSEEQRSGDFCKKYLDVWSLGILIIECVVKRLDGNVLRQLRPLIDNFKIESFKGFMKSFLEVDPKKRPPVDQLLIKFRELRKDVEEKLSSSDMAVSKLL